MGERHTLVHRIEDWAEQRPERPALHGKAPDGSWTTLSWGDYWRSVREVAKAFVALGHQPEESVAIVGANHPQWVQLQFGIQAAAGVPAPIYPTNTPGQVAHILTNSRSRIVIVDSEAQLAKFLAVERDHGLEPFTRIVTFHEIASADPRVVSFEALCALGREQPDGELDRRLASLTENTTCLLIYTSGTTGVPKGVMLDHAGQILVGESLVKTAPVFREEGRYRAVSYLPLCHQAEQTVTNVVSLEVGGEVFFCPDIAEVKDALVHARPTIFLGVPRVWEKFEAALRARLAEATGLKAKLARWALETELECFRADLEREAPAMPLRRRLARSLVVDKIRTALGLDLLEIAVTGAAPIAVSTQEFFASLAVPILEAYGMTETSGVATFTQPGRPVFGAVGKALDGVEIRIGDDGEIQLRGRNMTRGYLRMPEETEELYTEDGWLRTGDLGALDEEGNLRITGRLKELIITAGGKNVAPVEMENLIKGIDGVGQAVVVGDRQPYLCALVTLDPEGLPALCERLGIEERGLEAVARDPRIRSYLEERIESGCNQRVARYQTIKKFEVLPAELTVEGDELTPTMKIRRKVVAEKYADVIDGFYADARPADRPLPAAS